MNLMKSGRTLVLVAAAAMLAMVLQGCGGDDRVSQGRLDEEVAKTAAAEKAKMEAEAARKKAEADRAAADTAAEKAKMEAEATRTAAEKARMEAEATRTAAEKASKANKAEADRLKAEAEAARQRKAAAEKAEKEAMEKEAKLRADAEKKADHAKAEKLFALLLTESERGLGGATRNLLPTTGANTSPDFAAQGDFINDNLKLTSSTLTAEVPGYTQDTGRPRDLAGWSGVGLSRRLDMNDKIVIYSDQPSKKKIFRTYYAVTTTLVTGKDAYESTQNGTNRTLMNADAVGTVTTITRTSGVNTFAGTFRGAPGTFRCSGNLPASSAVGGNCGWNDGGTGGTVRLDAASTGWYFIPTAANAVFYDPYYYFGWWLNAAPSGDPEAFEPFYNAIRSTKRTNTNTLGSAIEGTATYKGAAAGKYAVRAIGEANTQAGDFVADVALNINFDADKAEYTGNALSTTQTTDDDGITIGLVMDNFRGEYPTIGQWLLREEIDYDVTIAGTQPLLNLYAKDGNIAWGVLWTRAKDVLPDTWHASGKIAIDFYGGGSGEAPDAALGVFEAATEGIVHLLGSFAATKQTKQ